MVESMQALKETCQKSETEPIDSRAVRRISIYLTWFLLHTPITANKVTILFLAVGVLGSFFLAIGSYWYAIVGALCLGMHLVLDHVDGEVARYRKSSSWFGVFLEVSCHQIVHASIMAGITWGVYRHYSPDATVFVFGFSALAFSLIGRDLWSQLAVALVSHPSSAGVDRAVAPETLLDLATVKKGEMGKGFVKSINTVLFSSGGFLALLLVATVCYRMDTFLYFYGIALPIRYVLRVGRVYLRRNLAV